MLVSTGGRPSLNECTVIPLAEDFALFRKLLDAAELIKSHVCGPANGNGAMDRSNLMQKPRFACSTSLADRRDPSPSLLRACRGGNSHSTKGKPEVFGDAMAALIAPIAWLSRSLAELGIFGTEADPPKNAPVAFDEIKSTILSKSGVATFILGIVDDGDNRSAERRTDAICDVLAMMPSPPHQRSKDSEFRVRVQHVSPPGDLATFHFSQAKTKSTMKLSLLLVLWIATLGISYAFTAPSISKRTRSVQLSAESDKQSRRSFVSAAIAVGASTIFTRPAFSDVSDGNALPQGAAQFSRVLKVKNDLKVSMIRVPTLFDFVGGNFAADNVTTPQNLL